MANNVFINGLSAVHAASGGVLNTTDICNTPSSSGTSPVPYPNVAQSADADKTAGTVRVNGNPVCMKSSIFAQSMGDEAGSKGGVKSGTTQGAAEFISGSPNVFIEGEEAARALDMMVSNDQNTPPMPVNQPGGAPPAALAAGPPEEMEPEAVVEYVSVVPVRYAVASREEDEPLYSWEEAGLATSDTLPELPGVRYVLSALREGFLYLYVDEALSCFSVSKNGQLRPLEKAPGLDCKQVYHALQLPLEYGEVQLAFSEHQWGETTKAAIVEDDAFRALRMQPFTLEEPGEDALPLEQLTELVEEYAGRGTDYPWRLTGGHNLGAAPDLLAKQTPAGQQLTALSDPLGMAMDLAALAEARQEELAQYMAGSDEEAEEGQEEEPLTRHRKKIIADTIESIYKGSENPDRLKRHVDEEARQAFLTEFDEEMARLRKLIRVAQKARAAYLAAGSDPETPLGAAWACYDLDDRDDCLLFEMSVANCLAGISAQVLSPEEWAAAPEAELIEQWLEAPIDESPLKQALMGNTELREIVENHAGEWGSLSDVTRNLILDIREKFPATPQTTELMRVIASVELNRADLHGAARQAVHEALERRLNSGNELLTYVLGARHGQHVSLTQIDVDTFGRQLAEATGLNSARADVQRIVTMSSNAMLKRGIATLQVTDVTTQTTAPSSGRVLTSQSLLGVSAGASAFMGYMAAWNLKLAVEQVCEEFELESSFNLAAALAAVGSAVNGALATAEAAAPNAMQRLQSTGRFTGHASRLLASRLAGNIAGYAGAILTGVTYGIKAGKAHGEGEWDAARYYTGASVTLAGGGAATTFGFGALFGKSTFLLKLGPYGWIAFGVVLIGGGIYLSIRGDRAIIQPVERWLDAGTFGRRSLPHAKAYATFDEEETALYELFYAPSVVDVSFSRLVFKQENEARIELFFPGYEWRDSRRQVKANGRMLGFDDLMGPPKREEGGAVIRYQVRFPRTARHSRVTFDVVYWPSPLMEREFTLTVTVPEPEEIGDPTEFLPGP